MEKYVYVLRTNDSEGKGYGGFQWPKKGKVEAPDWNPEPICGGGLHGLLNGEGGANLLNWGADAQWQVVKVLATDIVHIGTDKVKFPRGVVVYTGDRSGATSFLHAKIGNGFSIHGVATTAGDRGTATAGKYGTATAGDNGTATAGKYGVIECRWWYYDNDADTCRKRVATFYEGEDFKANVKYRFECTGKVCKIVEVAE